MSLPGSTTLEITSRTTVRRFPPRGSYDKQAIYAILDKAPMAHIAFDNNGSPGLLPMVFWRVDDYIYFHGAVKNRMFGTLDEQAPVCFVATILDGFVLARDALHHSVNYRCVIVYGEVERITDPEEKLQGLRNLVERFYPERWEKIMPPSQNEFDRVTMYKLPIREASAKVSAEPSPWPGFQEVPVWAGIVPVEMRMGEPVPDRDPATMSQQDFSRVEYVTGPRLPSQAPKAEVMPAKSKDEQKKASLEAFFRPETITGQIETVFQLADGSTRHVEANVGQSLMEAAKAADVPGIVGECCGSMTCATCHVVVVDDWIDRVPSEHPAEGEMLEFVEGGREQGSRLSCQIIVSEDMAGLTVKVPDEQR